MSEFVYHNPLYPMLEEYIDVKMFFRQGEMQKVEIKKDDEVVILSYSMFFTIMGRDALDLYEEAVQQEQESRL